MFRLRYLVRLAYWLGVHRKLEQKLYEARDGYIARVDVPFRRAMGNGTFTLGWVAR